MKEKRIQRPIDRDTIQRGVIAMVEKANSQWENSFGAEIGPETRLAADLDFDSTQLVQLVVRLEKHFKLKNLPFYQLLLSEEHVKEDLEIADIVDFMERVLNSR